MKSIRSSNYDAVLDILEETYPQHHLCSYENLGRITGDFEITNPSRFWNERCREVLSAIHDLDVTFHHYPDKYKMKMIASHEFESLFTSQLFPFLQHKIKDTKNPNPEKTAIMIKMCGNFLNIGLRGMKETMPSEFFHILQAKFEDIMTLMESINQYTKRLAPQYSKAIDFKFNFFEKRM